MTGQTDKLNPRHVDIEANSGMSTLMTENPLESTGTGLGLHISASVIDHISAQESHVHNLDSGRLKTLTVDYRM